MHEFPLSTPVSSNPSKNMYVRFIGSAKLPRSVNVVFCVCPANRLVTYPGCTMPSTADTADSPEPCKPEQEQRVHKIDGMNIMMS